MSFVIYELKLDASGEASFTFNLGDVENEDAGYSIAILNDTVNLEFGANYEGGAGTRVVTDGAGAKAWVEYSYTYSPDPRLVAMYESYLAYYSAEAEWASRGIGSEDDPAAYAALVALWEDYAELSAQAQDANLNPNYFRELEDAFAEHGKLDHVDSGTLNRDVFTVTPHFSGTGVNRETTYWDKAVVPGLTSEVTVSRDLDSMDGHAQTLRLYQPFVGHFPDFPPARDPNLWKFSETVTVHVTFEKSQLQQLIEDGYVIEGDKTPSNSVLIVVGQNGDWSTLSSYEVGDYTPENLEDTVKVLNSFPDYVAPDVETYIEEEIIDEPLLFGMGMEFTSDPSDVIVGFSSGEYTFSNDTTGDAPDAGDSWTLQDPDALYHTMGEDRESFYDGVADAFTAGLFRVLMDELQARGLRALGTYFSDSEEVAELAINMNENVFNPLLRYVDNLVDDSGELNENLRAADMIKRIDAVRDGLIETVAEKFLGLGDVFADLILTGRHSAYSYQMVFDPNDLAKGDSHSNRVVFGASDASYKGGGGKDYLYGGAGMDNLKGQAGADVISGGENRDVIFGGAGNDWMLGGGGFDKLIGGKGSDWMSGADGDDVLNGGKGDDTILGGDGFDQIRGADGNDLIRGGDSFDFLTGGKGNDTVQGGAGDDAVVGNGGRDKLYGNDGEDHLNGMTGRDVLFGGKGGDTFIFTARSGTDRVKDYELGTDILSIYDHAGKMDTLRFSDQGKALRIEHDGGVILLNNQAGVTLSESDFVFGS